MRHRTREDALEAVSERLNPLGIDPRARAWSIDTSDVIEIDEGWVIPVTDRCSFEDGSLRFEQRDGWWLVERRRRAWPRYMRPDRPWQEQLDAFRD